MKGPPAPRPKFDTLNAALAAAAADSSGLTFVNIREEEQVLPWAEVYRRARRAASAPPAARSITALELRSLLRRQRESSRWHAPSYALQAVRTSH